MKRERKKSLDDANAFFLLLLLASIDFSTFKVHAHFDIITSTKAHICQNSRTTTQKKSGSRDHMVVMLPNHSRRLMIISLKNNRVNAHF